jgi:O-antigen ligase
MVSLRDTNGCQIHRRGLCPSCSEAYHKLLAAKHKFAHDKAVIPSLFFGLTLFLLSADHLSLKLGGSNVKLGYFLILAFSVFQFGAVLQSIKILWKALPKWLCITVPFLVASIALSNSPSQSFLWVAWLGLGMLTLVTTHAYLKFFAFDREQIRNSAFIALGLIAFFGLVQFVSIYFFQTIIFEPQFHAYFYRINGLAGWPHFLNIFSFLIFPFVFTDKKFSWPERITLVLILFVLIESASKTGWVLFFGLVLSAFLFRRKVFVSHFLKFLIPVTILLTFVPTPHLSSMPNTTSGADRMSLMAEDLKAGAHSSGEDRILINKMGLQVWKRHPFFGVGPRAYPAYVQKKFDEELPGVNKMDVLHEVNTRKWCFFYGDRGFRYFLYPLAHE